MRGLVAAEQFLSRQLRRELGRSRPDIGLVVALTHHLVRIRNRLSRAAGPQPVAFA